MRGHRAAAGTADGPQLGRICDLIEARCGLDVGDARRSLLDASLRTRMGALGVDAVDGYLARLCGTDGAAEMNALINGITITETQFFRDPSQFDLLRHVVRTLLAEREPLGQRRLRICSAGCASGEEPYSIALTWRGMGLAVTHPEWTAEIVGIDVNTEILAAADRAVYSPRAVRNVDEDCLRRNFVPVGSNFRLDPAVAGAVRFEHGSVTDERALGSNRYDVILCKNVAIYFRKEMTRRLVRRLHEALTPGGYLLLGHSESLWQMEEGLELVEHDGLFCYRKPSQGPVATRVERASPTGPTSALAGYAEPLPDAGFDEEERSLRYDECLGLLRSGECERALRETEPLVDAHGAFVPGHLLLAGIHVHLGRYAQASACARRVLDLAPLEPKAHLLLGMIAARAGRADEAVDALRRALALDDSLALAYFWLGNLFRDQGDVVGACAQYARAVAMHDSGALQFTEQFAADLRPAQVVDFCRDALERLKAAR